MKLALIDYSSVPGSPHSINEDHIEITDNLILLFDGSTGLGRSHIQSAVSDASWFVKTIGKVIVNKWQGNEDFLSVLHSSIIEVKTLYESLTASGSPRFHEYPSAGMIALVNSSDLVSIYRLGDCEVFHSSNSQAINLFQNAKVEIFDAKAIMQFVEHLNNGLSINESLFSLKPLLIANRGMMNKQGGYSALTINENCIKFIEKKYMDLKTADRYLLATDGFSIYLEKYKRTDLHTLFKHLRTNTLCNIISKIRTIEMMDSNLRKYPRLKKSDDSTAVLLEVQK